MLCLLPFECLEFSHSRGFILYSCSPFLFNISINYCLSSKFTIKKLNVYSLEWFMSNKVFVLNHWFRILIYYCPCYVKCWYAGKTDPLQLTCDFSAPAQVRLYGFIWPGRPCISIHRCLFNCTWLPPKRIHLYITAIDLRSTKPSSAAN